MLVACKAADVTTEMIGSTDGVVCVVQSSGFAWSCCYSPVLHLFSSWAERCIRGCGLNLLVTVKWGETCRK